MIKAAIFDMDGLLIDSEPLWFEAAQTVLKPLGRTLKKEEYNATRGRGPLGALEDWYHMQSWQGPSVAEVEKTFVKEFLELVKERGEAMPGAIKVLEMLKTKGIPAALASSAAYENINTIVDKLGIRGYFDVFYSAEDETHSKPHPGVFISAARLLDVEPRFCVVFEDAPSGALAAKAAHMHCVAVPEPELKDHKFIGTADLILNSLEEFDEAKLLELVK